MATGSLLGRSRRLITTSKGDTREPSPQQSARRIGGRNNKGNKNMKRSIILATFGRVLASGLILAVPTPVAHSDPDPVCTYGDQNPSLACAECNARYGVK